MLVPGVGESHTHRGAGLLRVAPPRWNERVSGPRPSPPACIEAMRMTHAVAAWPPEPARGCCGGVRRPLCVSPVSPWQCLLSRPAERCRRMCREPGLELGGCLFTAHRRMVIQGKGVPLTTTFSLMVISHKFTNNHILLVHPELLLTTLLTTSLAAKTNKARPGVVDSIGDHVGSKKTATGESVANFVPFGDILSV